MTENESLSENDIAAFVDGTLTGSDLTRVQSLLAGDASARKELADVSRLISTAPHRKRVPPRWFAIGGIAAIAAVGLVMVRPAQQLQESSTRPTERRAPLETSDRIELVSPGEGQTIDKSSVTLTWRSIDGATYRVVFSDPAGRIIIDRSTNDTSVAIPLTSLSGTRGLLYWIVDAQAPDGSSVTSGPRALTITAK